MGSGGVRLQLRVGGKDRVLALSEEQVAAIRRSALSFSREPFTRRTYSELAYFIVGCPIAAFGIAFSLLFLGAGALARDHLRRGRHHRPRRTRGALVREPAAQPRPPPPRRGHRGSGSLRRSPRPVRLAAGGAAGQDRLEDDRVPRREDPLDALQRLVRDQRLVGCRRVPRLPALRAGRTRPAIYGVTYNMLHPGFFSVGSQA